MKKLILHIIAVALTVSLYAQNYAVYLTADDYTHNNPVKGTNLKETVGPGESNILLTLPDGTKKLYKFGSIWGYTRPSYPKSTTNTTFRYFDNHWWPITSSSTGLIAYDFPSYSMYEEHAVAYSNGADRPIKTTKSLTEIKQYMEPDLYPDVRKELEKDSKTPLSILIKVYNELVEKKPKSND